MERWLAKLIALVVIFVIVFAFTLLPIKVSRTFIRKGEKGKRIISCFMCFGGGVFLGVYMIHMAPDVRLLLDEVLMVPFGITYPVPDLIIVCGFFLMVFSENFVHSCQERSGGKHEKTLKTTSLHQDSTVALRLAAYTNTPADVSFSNDHWGRPLSLTYVDQRFKTNKDSETNGKVTKYEEISETARTNGHVGTYKQEMNGRHVDNHVTNDDVNKEEKHEHHGGNHDAHMQVTRSLVLLLALSLHHIFEGLSIGLKQTSASVWNLCLAIIAHEVVIAFSLGMQMVKTYKRTSKIVVAALMCSIMVPLGMIIGMALTETGTEQTTAMLMLNGTLQALATGVFIYVTFFEILQGELGDGKADFVKLIFMLAGFAVLALLALIPEDKGYELSHLSAHENGTANCSCPMF